MKNVIVKMMGGLGNQLFIYSFSLELIRKFNVNVIYDFSYYYTKTYNRIFQVDKILKTSELNRIVFFRGTFKKYMFFIFKNLFLKTYNLKNYKSFNKSIRIPYFDDYWQSEKYFIESKPLILSNLNFNINNNSKVFQYKDLILKNNSISLHIRRGDYLNQKSNLSNSYYIKAISYLEGVIYNPLIFIFTDDKEWVKNSFIYSKNQTLIEDCSDIEEFYLMTQCKHNIISNSSYSWWSAYLNLHPNKIIVRPSSKSILDYPSNWIKVNE